MPTHTPIPKKVADDLQVLADNMKELQPQMKVAFDSIKEIKPQIQSINDSVVAMQVNSHAPGSCTSMTDVQKKSEELAVDMSQAKVTISNNTADMDEIHKAKSKAIYWLLGAAVIVIGAVVGWLTTMTTVETNVGHLTEEQSKLRESVSKLTSSSNRQITKIEAATEAVEAATETMENGKAQGPSFDEWYKSLSPRGKEILKREMINRKRLPAPYGVDLH